MEEAATFSFLMGTLPEELADGKRAAPERRRQQSEHAGEIEGARGETGGKHGGEAAVREHETRRIGWTSSPRT